MALLTVRLELVDVYDETLSLDCALVATAHESQSCCEITSPSSLLLATDAGMALVMK